MKTIERTRVAAAIALALMASAAQADPVEFSGYFRSGAGSSNQGGDLVCTRLPGATVWFRLGNECDTYADLVFAKNLGTVNGTTFRTQFRMSYGTQGVAQWEQSTPAFREVFVEAQDIGAAMEMPALKGASLWAGKRFYGNRDIHMLDYGFWEPNYGVGAGIEKIDVGAGKFAYAVMRMGDFAGYGINTGLGGYNPDLIGGGSRSITVHDLRIEDIPVNPGGRVSLGADIGFKNNRDGTSSYTTTTTTPVLGVDGNTYNAVVQKTNTIDNTAGKNGYMLHAQHTQDNLFGLGGFNQVVLKYAKDAVVLRGYGIAGSNDSRKEWFLADQWVIEPKGSHVTASMTAGYRTASVNGVNEKEAWVGVRPQYHLNDVWSLMSEAGYQTFTRDGDPGTRKLAKLTLGTQFSMGHSIWSRPTIRFFTTYAKWNDAAAAAGSVTCAGRDCATPVTSYGNKRNATSYGVQIEGWF